MKVINKKQECEALQWHTDNEEEIKRFIGYKNRYSLYTEDGSQIKIESSYARGDYGFYYLSYGDWVIKQDKSIIHVLSDENFKEEYVEI